MNSKLFVQLIDVIIGFLSNIQCKNCIESVTTVSGPLSPQGKIRPNQLIFEDNFDNLNLKTWRHSLTLSGKGVSFYNCLLVNKKKINLHLKAYDFQWFDNNRSNSFVKNGLLYIRPTLVADIFGEKFLTEGTLNIHGSTPYSQ